METYKIRICFHCGAIENKMKSCGDCGTTYYCSQKCQKNDWINHKNICKGESKENKENSRYVTDHLSEAASLFIAIYTYHLYTQDNTRTANFRFVETSTNILGSHYVDIEESDQKLVTPAALLSDEDIIVSFVYFVRKGKKEPMQQVTLVVFQKKEISTIYYTDFRNRFMKADRWLLVCDADGSNPQIKFINKDKSIEILNYS